MPEHPDLESEQALLDYAQSCLEQMQDLASDMVAIGERSVRDENTVDAIVTKHHLDKRVKALQTGAGPLCFGRIDTDEDERWYVGRRHIEDEEARPVVVDWRAPVAAPYYRATAVDPCGLEFRRRFSVADGLIEAIFDEDLTDPDATAAVGVPDPLLAELDRSRSGQMSDIVATIAAEQDIIIRAPLENLLVVQGGPGTGKTAVGLHRAAFLLYQHRIHLLESNVLVIGPNPLFLRYIADVLPSLGETSVRQATLQSLVSAKYRVGGSDSGEAAELKGRAAMAQVIESAIRNRISAPADGLELRSGVAVVRFDQSDLQLMMKTVLDRPLPVNTGRDVFRQMITAESWRRYGARPDVDPAYETVFLAGLRSSADFKKAVDKMWPRLNASSIVAGLYSSSKRRREATDGLLSADEQQLLVRRGAKTGSEAWTVPDLALLDEAEARCDGVPLTYGHVIVDEAQDLSPMALRMIGRRATKGSMTVLGDLAQATSPASLDSWNLTVEHLLAAGAGRSREQTQPTGTDLEVDHRSEADADSAAVQLTELTVGYRVPAAILDVANRLLVEAAPTVTPARSVRPGGEPPRVTMVDPDQVGAAVAAEVEALQTRSFSIAVVAEAEQLSALSEALTMAGISADRVGGSGLPGRDAVAMLDPLGAKGLEFDAVIVVEPGLIAELPSGLRHLYVAMTRPVQYLGLVHSRPLPGLLGLSG